MARYGIRSKIVDDRDDKTSTGRADGLQPKTIETFRQLRLADSLLRKGVKIWDICFWVRFVALADGHDEDTKLPAQSATSTQPLHRTGREIHYPPQLDVKDPFILLVHQGMVEDVFIEDMRERGVEVVRSSPFLSYTPDHDSIRVICDDKKLGSTLCLNTKYLIGCDGAHSNVRKSIPGAQMVGESSNSKWGVLDGTSFASILSR